MLKKRTLSLLLSIAMLLTFMPAMAFAEDAADENSDQPAAVETVEDAVDEEVVEEVAAEEATEPEEALEAAEDEAEDDEAAVVKSISYSGPTLYYEPDEQPEDVYPFVEGAKFVITYNNGSENVVLKTFGDDNAAFFFEDEAPALDTDVDGDVYPVNAIWFDFDYEKASVENGLPVYYGDASTTIPIAQKTYPKAEKVEFVPVGDFVAESLIGENYLYTYNFAGEGNKFVVTYKNGDATETKEYVYFEQGDDWGFRYGNTDEYFWPEIQLNTRVAKGVATYAGQAIVDSWYGEIKVPISVKVSAEQYLVYAEEKTYSYTGKSIKPKVVVKYYDGKKLKKMPAKWYTCKPKKYKNIGFYHYEVKIKKKYQAKYGSIVYGYWDIIPKTPTIGKKATAGAGSLTVTWTKFSKAHQKAIDGFTIQVFYDKSCNEWAADAEAKPGDSKATVTGLEAGKTYYVRIVSHKTFGEDDYWESKPSKVKAVTVK